MARPNGAVDVVAKEFSPRKEMAPPVRFSDSRCLIEHYKQITRKALKNALKINKLLKHYEPLSLGAMDDLCPGLLSGNCCCWS